MGREDRIQMLREANMRRFLAALAGSESGNVVAMAAFGLPILIGGAALAIDSSLWETSRLKAQNAADQAALSAMIAFTAESSSSEGSKRAGAVLEGYAVADAYGYKNGTGVSVTVNNGPKSGKFIDDPNAFEVIIQKETSTLFSRIFSSQPPTILARAVSAKSQSSSACIVALDPSATPNVSGIVGAGSGGLNASGSGDITTTGCNIYVNSSSEKAIDVTGGGTVRSDNIYVVGNYSGNVATTEAPAPETGVSAIADPYGSRTIPSWDSCESVSTWSGTVTNPTGQRTFCGGIKVTGATTLEPGIYIILDGSLESSKPITGDGVTIILTSETPETNNGIFKFTSGATLNLTAPSTGPSAGMVLWADKDLPHNADHFKAGTTGNIEGAVYLPSHIVNYSGSATTGSQCTQLIAAQIAISGGANFSHNCDGVGVSDVGGGTSSRRGIVSE